MPDYGATDYIYDPEAAHKYANGGQKQPQNSLIFSKQDMYLTIIVDPIVTKEPESSLNYIPCSECSNEVLLKDEFKAEDNNYYCATCWDRWTRANVLEPAGLIDV